MDVINDKINWYVDLHKKEISLPEGSYFTAQKFAAYAKLKMFDLLIELNKYLEEKFSDDVIAEIVNTCYKNSLLTARLGIHGGYWKYEEESEEFFQVLRAFNTIMDKNLSKETDRNYYLDAIKESLEENAARELASMLNMFIKAEFEHDVFKLDRIDRYEFLMKVLKYVFNKKLISIDIFASLYIVEYEEFDFAAECFDQACDIIKGNVVDKEDLVDFTINILRSRTPELIMFVEGQDNNGLDPKCIKEIRSMIRMEVYNAE